MSLYQKFNVTVSPASLSRVSTITAIAGPKRRGQLPLILLRNLGLSQLLLHNNRSYRRDSHKLRDLSLGDGDVREKRLGYCYDFDGVNDYVIVPGDAALSPPQVTVTAWAKFDSFTGCIANNELTIRFMAPDVGVGKLSVRFATTVVGWVEGVLLGNTDLQIGQWYYISLTIGDGYAKLYLNGVEDGSRVAAGTVLPTSNNLILCARSSTQYRHDGMIFDLRMYSRVLAPDEITHLYTNGQSGTNPGTDNLVAHYPLQEEAGTTAYDISGNGNHGTIMNAVTSGVGSIHQPDAGVVKSYPNAVGYSDRNNLLLWTGWTIVGGSVPARKSGDLLTLNRSSGGNSAVLVNGVTISNAFADKRAGQLKLTIQSISGPTAATHLRLDISGTTHRLYGAGTYYINLQDNHSIGYVAMADHSSLTISELEFIGPKDAVFPYVPAASSTLDATGGALTVTGRCPNDGLIKSSAWQGNGSDVGINVGEPVIPENDDCEISLWFKTTVVENSMLLMQAINFSSTYSWFYLRDTGNISVRISGILVEFNSNYADGNWHSLRAVLVGSTLTVFYDDKVYSTTGTKVGVAQGNLGILYRLYIPDLRTSAQVASVSITASGVTTTYVPIEGTRNVAKLTSDGSDTRIITDAVIGGTLETLYTLGDGSWRHPVIENGGRWDGTSLIPADLLGNSADGEALNIQPHTHPRGLLLDRTGGVVAPIDYQTGTANHTEEEYNDIPAEVTLNKRGLSIYAADRYGASLADIQSNPAYQILVKTDNAGTSNSNQFTLPATGTYTIDWGDGTVEEQTGAVTHTYSVAGEYVIKVTGGLTRIFFNNGGDRRKLLEVQNWGDAVWSSFNAAYYGCSNCLFNATDALVLPADCARAFQNCTPFNQSVANFNTAAVTTMSHMFASCTAFNQSVANFDTAKVAAMSFMFFGCINFNQSVANFDTAAVTTMQGMVENCINFNQSVANFDTAKVGNMANMFRGCTAFNQSVANFDTAKVTNMSHMFTNCTAFNQSVANFDTAKVTNMSHMFANCTAFNQSVANFDTAKVTDMVFMFFGCTAFKQSVATFSLVALNNTARLGGFATSTNINATDTTTNYDATLIAWAAQLPLAHGFAQSPNFGTAKFSAGAAADAKAALVAAGWSFTDGGQAV